MKKSKKETLTAYLTAVGMLVFSVISILNGIVQLYTVRNWDQSAIVQYTGMVQDQKTRIMPGFKRGSDPKLLVYLQLENGVWVQSWEGDLECYMPIERGVSEFCIHYTKVPMTFWGPIGRPSHRVVAIADVVDNDGVDAQLSLSRADIKSAAVSQMIVGVIGILFSGSGIFLLSCPSITMKQEKRLLNNRQVSRDLLSDIPQNADEEAFINLRYTDYAIAVSKAVMWSNRRNEWIVTVLLSDLEDLLKKRPMHTASDFIDCYVESMNMSKRKILGAKDKEKDIVNAIVGLWIQHRTTQETLSDERTVTVRKKRLKKDILQYICQFSAGIRTASNKSRACLAISHGYSKKTWNSATDPRVKTALKKYLIWLVKENQLMYQRSEISHGR